MHGHTNIKSMYRYCTEVTN